MAEKRDKARRRRKKPGSCRMFDTPFIEFFSHIHTSPFLFWLPVLAILAGVTLYAGMSPALFVGLMVLGALAWSLVEYTLHRYVFHYVGPRPWQRRFHFIAHGVHHDFPQDVERLVMPLGVSIPLGLGFFLAGDAVFSRPVAAALFCGFALGYLAYDGLHYFTHHGKAKSKLAKFLKRYHLVHHHVGLEGMWGVTSPLWDWAFGTSEDLRPGKREPKVGATS